MITNHPSDVLCPLPRRIERVRVSITSPLVQPSPNGRRVGIRIVTFEACSGFTRVTARRIAQPPKVTFVTRLRSRQLPSETARQLPDLSTIIRVEPSSTDDSHLQGALPIVDMANLRQSLRSSAHDRCSDQASVTADASYPTLRSGVLSDRYDRTQFFNSPALDRALQPKDDRFGARGVRPWMSGVG